MFARLWEAAGFLSLDLSLYAHQYGMCESLKHWIEIEPSCVFVRERHWPNVPRGINQQHDSFLLPPQPLAVYDFAHSTRYPQLPQYAVDNPKLLAEFHKYEKNKAAGREEQEGEEGGESAPKPAVTSSRRRLPQRMAAKAAEAKLASTGDLEDKGAQQEGRPQSTSAPHQTTRRRSQGATLLPDEKLAWDFLKEVKRWKYAGNGWDVKGPDDGSKSRTSASVS